VRKTAEADEADGRDAIELASELEIHVAPPRGLRRPRTA
jgi:hypothetical protein